MKLQEVFSRDVTATHDHWRKWQKMENYQVITGGTGGETGSLATASRTNQFSSLAVTLR